jgi:hypothetical protein
MLICSPFNNNQVSLHWFTYSYVYVYVSLRFIKVETNRIRSMTQFKSISYSADVKSQRKTLEWESWVKMEVVFHLEPIICIGISFFFFWNALTLMTSSRNFYFSFMEEQLFEVQFDLNFCSCLKHLKPNAAPIF